MVTMSAIFSHRKVCAVWRTLYCQKNFSTSSKRPPKKIVTGSVRKGQKNELKVFTAAGIAKFNMIGNKQIKKMHAILIPQFLLNFTGLGVPMLDYYLYTAVPAIAVLVLVSHPFISWVGSSKIIDLSLDPSTKEVHLQSTTQAHHTIPASQCSMSDKKFAAGNVTFSFYNVGNFNNRNLQILKKTLESSSAINGPEFKLDRTKDIFSGSYLIFLIGSCVAIVGIYLTTGFTDLAYLMKMSGDLCEQFFGLNVFEKQFGRLILNRDNDNL